MTTKSHTPPELSDTSLGSRRSVLRKIATGSALSAAPKIWVAPAVVAVTLPVHAQSSECNCVALISAGVVLSNFAPGVGTPPIGGFAITIKSAAPATDPVTITSISSSEPTLSSVPSLPAQVYSGKDLVFAWVGEMAGTGKTKPAEDVLLTVQSTCCDGSQKKNNASLVVNLKSIAPSSSLVAEVVDTPVLESDPAPAPAPAPAPEEKPVMELSLNRKPS